MTYALYLTTIFCIFAFAFGYLDRNDDDDDTDGGMMVPALERAR